MRAVEVASVLLVTWRLEPRLKSRCQYTIRLHYRAKFLFSLYSAGVCAKKFLGAYCDVQEMLVLMSDVVVSRNCFHSWLGRAHQLSCSGRNHAGAVRNAQR